MATATAHHYATVNPYTGEVVREFDSLDAAAVDRAVETAHEAFGAWRDRPIEERAAIVRGAGKLLAEQRDRLAALVTLEMGKRNYPLYQVARIAAPNLVLGNTILLKHASSCPQSALALEQVFRDAGVPAGVFTNLFIETGDIAAVIESPRVHGVSLTGSEGAGAPVAEQAGRNLKKSVLELGGSDPFIVLDAEHLERTVDAAVKGRLGNMGQSCVASKRFIVLHEHYDAFVSGMRDRFAALTPGDPADPATTLAPLSSERAAQALIHQVEDAAAQGATVVIGGGRPDLPGAFVEPTILTGVSPAMRAYHEELFGPVAVVHSVAARTRPSHSRTTRRSASAASVFAADIGRAQRVAARLDAGMVWINRPAASRPELAFGGIKRSGYGRELGAAGIEEFANRKLICAVAPDAPFGGFAG